MSTIHKQMALADVLPDMILSDAVTDAQGNILLAKGAVLTQGMLDALARHEIDFLPILSGQISEQEDAAIRAHYQTRLARLFRHTAENAATDMLEQYVRHFRLGADA